jgi:hypothetical protein
MTDTSTAAPWLLVVSGYIERIFWTFVQSFVTYAAARTVLDWSTAEAAAAAGAAACLTVALGVATDWAIPTTLPFGILTLLRILRTWLVSVLTILLSAPDIDLTVGAWKIALIASLPAVLAAVKAIAVERLAGGDSPATLPAGLNPLSPVTPNLTLAA